MNVTMQPLQFSSSIFALPFFLMVMKHVKLLFVDYTDFWGILPVMYKCMVLWCGCGPLNIYPELFSR